MIASLSRVVPLLAVVALVLMIGGCGVLPVSSSKATARMDGPQVVYVSAGGSKQILVYDVDNASGRLTLKQEVDAGGAPGSLALSPDHRFLYAAIRDGGQAATFAINPTTGELSDVGRAPIDGNAAYISTDNTGRYLLAAYYGDGKVTVHAIGEDGVVQAPPLQVAPTAKNAHAIKTDATNRIAYVPHTGPNAVYQFRFDQEQGLLTSMDPPLREAPTDPNIAGPRHYTFHPTLDVVYFVNELGSSVTVWPYDKSSGRLGDAVQTISTLPLDFAGKNTCADIHVSDDGKYIYASNRGHDSLAVYKVIDEGRLELVEIEPTEKTPRAFAIDNSGNYVYAAGQGSGKLAAYRRYSDSGRLFPIATYDAGKAPAWVTVLTLQGATAE